MIDVVSDLVGEIVEIYEWNSFSEGSSYSLRGRGVARAVYVADKHLMILVEHNLGWDSHAYGDRTKDGGFEAYSLHDRRARVVQRCARCGSWDQKALLVATYPGEGTEKTWEHKAGEGCKKLKSGENVEVGHGG